MNFVAIRLLFWVDVDIEKVLVSSKFFLAKKCNKHFIAYFYDNHEVKPLQMVLESHNAF